MFANFFVVSSLILALASQVLGHAAVAPMLGVAGTPKRSDVERPSKANPCGAGVKIGRLLDSSTAVPVAADGSFPATSISFNGGKDGARLMAMKVSADGQGTAFVPGTVPQNGLADPGAAGSQPIVGKLPPGTQCTGGAGKNKCLVQFESPAGFGNCVVVQQAAGKAKQAGNAAGGTRAARALLAELEQRGEDAVELVKRKASQWIWA